VEIRQWEESNVKVSAKKKTSRGGKLDNTKIQVTIQDDTMKIETIDLVKNPRVSVTYDVRVPAEVIVNYARTSNGEIELEGTQGDATLETSNGKIEIKDINGDIWAGTSNGKIEIEDVDVVVSAETSNGNIEIIGVTGIKQVETSNGEIEAEIPAIQDDDIRIKTSNGSIKLYLSPDLDADFEMKTSNGRIKLHDLEVVASEISRTRLKGKIGDGGNLITVKTSNGRIDLYQLQ
jgi:DUF4097 and DUF4098 domain-containing protein YvlB